jgi:hypothetical protein
VQVLTPQGDSERLSGLERPAATVPEVDRRLPDALEFGSDLRVLIEVLLHLRPDLILGLTLETSEDAFTSGCVNRYADVAADTPDMTPARSAAVQFGGGWAAAGAAVPSNTTPATAVAPIAPASVRCA